jgi:hypothetical protein
VDLFDQIIKDVSKKAGLPRTNVEKDAMRRVLTLLDELGYIFNPDTCTTRSDVEHACAKAFDEGSYIQRVRLEIEDAEVLSYSGYRTKEQLTKLVTDELWKD